MADTNTSQKGLEVRSHRKFEEEHLHKGRLNEKRGPPRGLECKRGGLLVRQERVRKEETLEEDRDPVLRPIVSAFWKSTESW